MPRFLPPPGVVARVASGALVILAVTVGPARASRELAPYYHAHRPEGLEPVAGEPPREVRVLPPGGPQRWSAAVRERLENRVRAEWPRDRTYGALQSAVGLWLSYPLVTGRAGNELLVPVLMSRQLRVRGAVDLRGDAGPRRVVLLIDASSSGNTRSLLRTTDGAVEHVTPLEAERSAMNALFDVVDRAKIELGVIAYGEATWPLAEPGTPIDEIRRRASAWAAAQPRGVGRTDLICALEVARDWLKDTPKGMSKEIFLLTDGGLPHSGRFEDCNMNRRHGGKEALEACKARQNTSVCPASRKFSDSDGFSDLRQLEAYGRRVRRKLTAYPLVFDATRPARPYRELAEATGGDLYRVPSAEALEAALPAMALRQVTGVYAVNERSGEKTDDLFDPKTGRFDGVLPLRHGANDVLLQIQGLTGPAALYRFRIYAEPNYLKRILVKLRNENRELTERVARGTARARERLAPSRSRERELEVEPEGVPAAPAED